MKTNKEEEIRIKKSDWMAALAKQGLTISAQSIHLTGNESSYGEIISALHNQLNGLDSEAAYYYMEEVYDKYIVYCSVNRKTNEKKMYKQMYAMQQDGTIKFSGDPVKVKKEVTYTAMTRTNFKNKSEMKTNTKCTCTVDSLISNERTNFTEDDREWLSDLSQEQLEKLAPKEVEQTEPAVNKKKETPAAGSETSENLVATNKEGKIILNGKSIEDHVREIFANESDPVKFIDKFMPKEVANQMKLGLSVHKTRRAKLIKEIVANSKFKEDKLKTMDDEYLETLHASVVTEEEPAGNYAPLGGGSLEEGEESEEGSDEEITAMLSFTEVSTPKKETSEKKK